MESNEKRIEDARKKFVTKAKAIHGNKYDYSKVNYVNAKEKVCIICPTHGEFWQRPNGHLNGLGCDKCGKTYSYTTEEFIEKAKEIHGNKYDYSKVKYINAQTKVCIICPIHGEFWQNPSSHLQGHGCKMCSSKNKSDKLTKKTQEFVKEVKEIHGDKYDYSKVKYVNNRTKVCIICPEHGEFWKTPYKHLNLKEGCQKCSNKYKRNTEEFIEKAKEIHGDKYDYSKVEYVNNKTKVCMICPTHGEFWQRPFKHLFGDGCKKCYESKLEKEVRIFFENKNIHYISQKHFKWLGKQSLDFYLPEYNVGIECQGEQHFKPKDFFGGENAYIYTRECDERKRKLCEENNIKLLYYSNLEIDYPYKVYKNKEEMLEEIKIEANK